MKNHNNSLSWRIGIMSIKNIREVLIIRTGGTIEKTYSEFDGTLKNRKKGLEKNILSNLRLPYVRVELQEILFKDSIHLTDEDRSLIVTSVLDKHRTYDSIIILHGTDTIVQTGTTLLKELKDLKIPIILTGSMKPLEMIASDALQNITESLVIGKLLNPGVYLSFHSEIFQIPYVRKDHKRNTFMIHPK